MIRHSDISLVPAMAEQAPIVANLLELYAHDFSQFHNLEIGEDGRFGYPSLALYWSDPDRHPFLIRMDDKLAGLALVKNGSGVLDNLGNSSDGPVWDMAEFFILRGFRRRGIGTQAAHEVWRRFPGAWEVRVMKTNVSARLFWAEAISKFVGQLVDPADFENCGEHWSVFSFESKNHA